MRVEQNIAIEGIRKSHLLEGGQPPNRLEVHLHELPSGMGRLVLFSDGGKPFSWLRLLPSQKIGVFFPENGETIENSAWFRDRMADASLDMEVLKKSPVVIVWNDRDKGQVLIGDPWAENALATSSSKYVLIDGMPVAKALDEQLPSTGISTEGGIFLIETPEGKVYFVPEYYEASAEKKEGERDYEIILKTSDGKTFKLSPKFGRGKFLSLSEILRVPKGFDPKRVAYLKEMVVALVEGESPPELALTDYIEKKIKEACEEVLSHSEYRQDPQQVGEGITKIYEDIVNKRNLSFRGKSPEQIMRYLPEELIAWCLENGVRDWPNIAAQYFAVNDLMEYVRQQIEKRGLEEEYFKRGKLLLLETEKLGFGEIFLEELEAARREVEHMSPDQLLAEAKVFFHGNEFAIFRKQPEVAQREMLASAMARERGKKTIIEIGRSKSSEESTKEEKKVSPTAIIKGREGRTQFGKLSEGLTTKELFSSLNEIFPHIRVAKRGLLDWVQLPFEPLVIPHDYYPNMPLSELIWRGILYSQKLVDKQGREVGMDNDTYNAYLNKVASFIKEGLPILLSEYIPLIAIPNPLKRRTQNVAMAEVDFFRRLLQVDAAVRIYYPPGVRWYIINEIPAFAEAFGLDDNYVTYFHNTCQQIVDLLNAQAGRDVIVLTNMADYLWGDEQKKEAWTKYVEKRSAEMREAIENPQHPKNKDVTAAITTFTYPMATCINPYECEDASSLTPAQIVAVYEKLRAETGSIMRGVGMGEVLVERFSPAQERLLEWLRWRGKELAFIYRLTMDSRDVLPAFKPLDVALKYTMVTKRNKPVLYPNSRRGPSLPAHGDPVFFPEDTTVTVRPNVSIIADKYSYVPWVDPNTGELLYYTVKD
jgi:hypothetical protein